MDTATLGLSSFLQGLVSNVLLILFISPSLVLVFGSISFFFLEFSEVHIQWAFFQSVFRIALEDNTLSCDHTLKP